MKRVTLLCLLCIAGLRSVAQDSVYVAPAPRGPHRDSLSWDHYEPGVRVAGGFQRSWFIDLGFSLQKMTFSGTHGYFHGGFYASGTWVPPAYREKGVLGIGIGGELGSNGGSGCIDLRYYSDGDREDLVLSPKYMFGVGLIDLGYGYNISFNNRPFPQIGRHQVVLRVNTNLFVHEWKKKARKRRALRSDSR